MKVSSLTSPACITLAALCFFPGAASAAHHPRHARKSTAQAQRGWHTYRNPDYGFTIQYPPSIKLLNSARGENTGGSAPVCDDTTIACLAYSGAAYKGTNFTGGGIAINVLRDAKSPDQCEQFASADYPRPASIRTVDIHGTRFHAGSTSDAGMSHYQNIRAWRALYQNVCFEIRSQIDTVSLGVYDPGTLKPFHPARLESLFGQVMHTFRFVGPVKDGAAWKVSRDNGCGGTYEYPADAPAEIVVDNTAAPSGSNRIACSRTFTYRDRNYTLDVKSGPVDDVWLKSSGYPPLKDATVVDRSARYTEYQAGPYHYIHGGGNLYIFSASDGNRRAIDPGDDPIYRHWLASFKTTQ